MANCSQCKSIVKKSVMVVDTEHNPISVGDYVDIIKYYCKSCFKKEFVNT